MDFDPTVISYEQILDIVWDSHNALRNFGGKQYRHAIWYHGEEQKAQVEASVSRQAEKLKVPTDRIVTAVEPAGQFTYAEDYHQKYILRRQKDIISDLEALFADHFAFTDSAAMTRLNGWFGNGESYQAATFRDIVDTFGLPENLEKKVISVIR